jgi:hypothetical protein
MSSNLCGRVKRIDKTSVPDAESLSVEIEITNSANNRSVLILNHDVQLWQTSDNGYRCSYISSFLLNQRKYIGGFRADLGPGESRSFLFLWQYSEEQIQQIEDRRKESSPLLELHAQFLTCSTWPERQPQTEWQWELVSDADINTWPMDAIIRPDDWIRLLQDIGFQSTIAPRISVPPLPPAFRRSAEILKIGWSNHFDGNEKGALERSRESIECLPFRLFDTPGKWNELVKGVLDHAPQEKVEAVDGLINALGKLCHLARHEKGEPVPLQRTDSELALTCAAAILKYLAVHFDE